MVTESKSVRVPVTAGLLGGLGVVPFLGLTASLPFLNSGPKLVIAHALAAYGATILSFLGGIHWGLAIAGTGAPGSKNLTSRLVLSVVPPLAGWVSLLLSASHGLIMLSVVIAMMLWVDVRAARIGEVPPW